MRVLAFDSGVGGLSAVAPILKTRPDVQLSYFGDLANLPYGTKSPERVRSMTEKNLRALLSPTFGKNSSQSYDLLLLACNTVSAHALNLAKQIGGKYSAQMPVIGVLEPSCKEALRRNPPRIVVLATSSTVSSHAYVEALKSLGAQMPILQKACPLFVPLVEDGVYSGPAAEWIIRRYLDSLLQPGDAVILGCTHYPYLLDTLRKIYPNVSWIEAGVALLHELESNSILPAPKAKAASQNHLEIFFSDKTQGESQVRSYLKALDLSDLAFSVETVSNFT